MGAELSTFHLGNVALCAEEDPEPEEVKRKGSRKRHRRRRAATAPQSQPVLERLAMELFRLQDLDGNGFLEEVELIKLNEKIAMLHYGLGTDKQAVKDKYKTIFRKRLDSDGLPVPYSRFRVYILELIQELDPDINAQEMILEQFIRETEMGRAAFHCPAMSSLTDVRFLANIPVDEGVVFDGMQLSSDEPDSKAELVSDNPSNVIASHQSSTASKEMEGEGNAMQCVPARNRDNRDDDDNVSDGALKSPLDLRNGDLVQVWSGSLKRWLDGEVSESAESASYVDGRLLPAGSRRISWSTGHKWVMPDDIPTLVRRLGTNVAPCLCFEPGEHVEVWSNSTQMWLEGVVQDVYKTAGLVGTLLVPPGTVRVCSRIGEKFVAPEHFRSTLRKHALDQQIIAKSVAEYAQFNDAEFQRHVSVAWTSSGHDSEGRLERTRVAAAMHRLSTEIGLDSSLIDPRCLDAALNRLGMFGAEAPGVLLRDDFVNLCHELLSELNANVQEEVVCRDVVESI